MKWKTTKRNLAMKQAAQVSTILTALTAYTYMSIWIHPGYALILPPILVMSAAIMLRLLNKLLDTPPKNSKRNAVIKTKDLDTYKQTMYHIACWIDHEQKPAPKLSAHADAILRYYLQNPKIHHSAIGKYAEQIEIANTLLNEPNTYFTDRIHNLLNQLHVEMQQTLTMKLEHKSNTAAIKE